MKDLTLEVFENAIKNITYKKLTMRKCSLCNYTLNYIIQDGKLFFDSGCDCVNWANIQPKSPSSLHDWYISTKNTEFKKKILDFLEISDNLMLKILRKLFADQLLDQVKTKELYLVMKEFFESKEDNKNEN